MLSIFKRCVLVLLTLTLTLFTGLTHAQTTAGAVGLRAEAQADAKIIQKLADKTPIKMIKRQGFWVEVEVAGAKGWLKVSEVSLAAGGASGGGLGGLDTGRTGKGNIVSTSAARGLTAKELVAAKPDPQQVNQLKSLAVSASSAEAFAKAGGLSVRQVALLSAAATESNSPQPSAGSPSKSAASKATAKRAKASDDDEEDDDE